MKASVILPKIGAKADRLLPITFALVAIFFVFDTLLPAELAAGFLYIPIVLLSFWIEQKRSILIIAALTTLLAVVGYIASPPSPGYGDFFTILNRGLAIAIIWWAALLALAHREARRALVASEQDLLDAQRLARLGRLEIRDKAGATGFLSKETLDVLGIPNDGYAIPWQGFLDNYVHEDDRSQVKALVSRAYQHGLSFEFEFRIVQSNGSMRKIRCIGERRSESTIRVVATLFDMTALRSAEELALQKEMRLRSILETIPEALVTIGETGCIESFSRSAEELFGYKASEVLGENVRMLMPAPRNEQHDQYIQRVLTTRNPKIIGIGTLVMGLRRDGTTFPMDLAVGEAMVGGQRIFTCFIRDLTSRQKIEQELRQSQKMEAIGQLTGGIAHDFNNLLTVAIGNLEMIEASPNLGAEDRAILSEVQDAAQQGANLTERLLAFGRRQPLNPILVDIGELVSDFSRLLRRTLGEAIDMRLIVSGDRYFAFVDSVQFQNALLNLALNARDAMPQGGSLTLEVSYAEIEEDYAQIYPEAKAGRFVLLSVTDTGIGMSQEVKQKAFEPFFTTKPIGTGTGLGLCMVYGFIKQSGGLIHLYSETGKGTTVQVFLPLAENEKLEDEVDPILTSQDFPARGETILLTEDDAQVRRVTVARLKALGYTVVEAANGLEALKILKGNQHIDLLFTDIVMSEGMTGGELAQVVRRAYPKIRILLTTGYTEPDIIKQEIIGGSLWLKKPYTALDLARKTREALGDGVRA
ncbi:PAS domain S-box protein [Microvirga sp. 2TAF3]|uniref:hybrid sensor histidine kinase/response regulator n=1 Tax=Microvirga sp. 2TAF3 TaxID=3233014 RepID=UPI003F9CD022